MSTDEPTTPRDWALSAVTQWDAGAGGTSGLVKCVEIAIEKALTQEHERVIAVMRAYVDAQRSKP